MHDCVKRPTTARWWFLLLLTAQEAQYLYPARQAKTLAAHHDDVRAARVDAVPEGAVRPRRHVGRGVAVPAKRAVIRQRVLRLIQPSGDRPNRVAMRMSRLSDATAVGCRQNAALESQCRTATSRAQQRIDGLGISTHTKARAQSGVEPSEPGNSHLVRCVVSSPKTISDSSSWLPAEALQTVFRDGVYIMSGKK